LFTLAVELVLAAGEEPGLGDRTVLVNSPYGTSYFRAFDIRAGTALEVAGYLRPADQCVVETLTAGTLEPGLEGYVRPAAACPSAGADTFAVVEQAPAPLGCAVAPVVAASTAIQHFQGGLMLYLGAIYVLLYEPGALDPGRLPAGTWSGVRDTFRAVDPVDAGLATPPDLHEPKFGFGKAWREHYGGPDGPLGWALAPESTDPAYWQQFERGIVAVTEAGDGLLLYLEGRAWAYRTR
jgi:hypothetical protein